MYTANLLSSRLRRSTTIFITSLSAVVSTRLLVFNWAQVETRSPPAPYAWGASLIGSTTWDGSRQTIAKRVRQIAPSTGQ